MGNRGSQDSTRYDDYVTAFFGNITSASQKAIQYLAGRYEDITLLAETHKNQQETDSLVRQFGSLGWQCTTSPAKQSDKAESGTVASVLAGVRRNIDNRPLSICSDHEGKRTPNPFLTGRIVVIEGNEILALAGYLEGGGLKGTSLDTLSYVDNITRGGKDLFLWALDANVPPEAWAEHKVGKETWLDKMNAEIITVRNSKFTCRAGLNKEGGSMIDYIVISKPLLALVRYLGAVMDAPWSPHFGLTLTLYAKPSEILIRILVKPTLPENTMSILKQKEKEKVDNAKEVRDEIQRHRNREEDVAKNIIEHADKAKAWSKHFFRNRAYRHDPRQERRCTKGHFELLGCNGTP